MTENVHQQAVKNIFHHRGTENTEVYIVNRACGAVNNNRFFSVLSVSLW